MSASTSTAERPPRESGDESTEVEEESRPQQKRRRTAAGKWTPSEEKRLIALVESDAGHSWDEVVQALQDEGFGARTRRACQDRYRAIEKRREEEDDNEPAAGGKKKTGVMAYPSTSKSFSRSEDVKLMALQRAVEDSAMQNCYILPRLNWAEVQPLFDNPITKESRETKVLQARLTKLRKHDDKVKKEIKLKEELDADVNAFKVSLDLGKED
ncbi:hypothetical protein JCM10908_006624 [Rhodotorula pacifica]|uniref:SANT/Myb-like DNA-binding domain-containing protein n=1 Tax=Rhodotorula pacifica TaxID=1495444 RepID=UPI003179A76F